MWVFGTGAGFQVTVPADASQRTLKVYAGVWSAGGKFEDAVAKPEGRAGPIFGKLRAFGESGIVEESGAGVLDQGIVQRH